MLYVNVGTENHAYLIFTLKVIQKLIPHIWIIVS